MVLTYTYEGKTRSDLISMILNLQCQLNKANEKELADKSTQTSFNDTEMAQIPIRKTDQGCQTSAKNTAQTAVQTAPIPAPRRLSQNLKLSASNSTRQPRPVPAPRRLPKETATIMPTGSEIIDVQTTQNSNKPKRKTNLIIGSSVLKGIKIKGLHDTDVRTIRGGTINRITDELMRNDLSSYKNIILQIGGNDIAQHGDLKRFEDDYESLLYATRAYANRDTNIIVSGLLFRSDVCTYSANLILENLCDFLGLMFINQYKIFNETAFSHYTRDGIHLSRRGTSAYLKSIHKIIAILKSSPAVCANCGEQNHQTILCNYEKKLKCFRCGFFGHKQKFCEQT